MKNVKLKAAMSLMLAGAMSLSLLAGCGNKTADNAKAAAETKSAAAGQNAATPAAPAKPVDIRVMTSWTAGSAAYEQMNKMVDTFNNGKSGVKIVHDALPSNDLRTKLTVEMAAGTPPDVAWCVVSYAREYAKDNKIIDWKPIFEDPKHPEFKQWFDNKSLYFATNQEGKVMMAPQEGSIDGLYYNKEMFEKNGWQPPKTFDDMIDLAKKAKEKKIAAIVTGGKDMRFAWLASALLVRTGGLKNATELALGSAMTKWDDPQYGFVDAMKKFKQLVDAGAYPQGVLGLSASEADQMFARGEAAMYYEGAWKQGNFEKAGGKEFVNKVGRVNFPVMNDMPKGDKDINVGGNIIGFIVANGLSKEKTEASIKVVKEIVSPQFNVPIMEKGGFVYAGKSDYDKTKVSAVMNDLIDAYRKAPGFILSMDSFAAPSVELSIKQTAMPGIISGEYDVNKAVAEVQKAAQDYAKAQKK